MSAGAAEAAACTWSSDLFGLIAEPDSGRETERLALCTLHQPPHVLHGRPGDEWCQALPPQRRPFRPERRARSADETERVQLDETRLGQILEEAMLSALRRAREERSR